MLNTYEISVWEDVLIPKDNNIPEHYEEQKIAVIGSNNINSQSKAFSPNLISNINGTNTFTFKMYYSYIDNQTGEKIINPFINLLINERKIKVKWKDEWYDFVIKNIQKNLQDKSITYTCSDLAINELSKNGFNLEFDTELENNIGTITELANVILDGTGWQVDANSDLLQEKIEEPVYECTTIDSFVTKNQNNEEITIPTGKKILVFYSIVQNRPRLYQFLYTLDNDFKQDQFSTSMLVTNGINCFNDNTTYVERQVDNVTYLDIKVSQGDLHKTIASINLNTGLSDKFRGQRLVRKQLSLVDPILDQIVNIYEPLEEQGNEIYGYSKNEFKDPTYVYNLTANNKDFANTSGWSGGGENNSPIFRLYPDYRNLTEPTQFINYSAKSYLQLKAIPTWFLNSGIKSNMQYLQNGFLQGEKYIFRFKGFKETNNLPNGEAIDSNCLNIFIGNYTASDNNFNTSGESYFSIDSYYYNTNENWNELQLTCNKSITRGEILVNNFGILIRPTQNIWIENIEFFPYILGDIFVEVEPEIGSNPKQLGYYEFVDDVYILTSDESPISSKTYYTTSTQRINPGDMNMLSLSQKHYYYYESGQNVTNKDEIIYLYSGLEENPEDLNLIPVYNTNFEKIRSITGKESNRFNLLQTLCETFECYIKFTIYHDDNGKCIYEDGVAKKDVSFHSVIGNELGITFKYGIDLKTIERQNNSEQIVTKVIVLQNNNEYAENGFCTISRSEENYSKQNYVLDFGYYFNNNLLDYNKVTKDLYQTDGIGYYYWLNKYSTEYDNLTDELVQRQSEYDSQSSFLTTYQEYLNSLNEELTSINNQLFQLSGKTSIEDALEYFKNNPDFEKGQTLILTRENLKSQINSYEDNISNLQIGVNTLKEKISAIENRQKELTQLIKDKDAEFYKKYYNFIQEGTWTSEDYIDDNLYYLDAVSVAYESSRPQLSYSISVIRLNDLEEYKAKKFKCGDLCYVQDTDFFGTININGVITPKKEQVIISELSIFFDEPNKDSIKVQNYKSKFEDLFQKITSTTQSLQYNSGSYEKAANIVQSNGLLKPQTLSESIQDNKNLIISSQNNSIFNDSTGTLYTSLTKPNEKLKICSSGIFLTQDGGETWISGLKATGVSGEQITSGVISTQYVYIMNKEFPTYRWDENGISSFRFTQDNLGNIINIDYGSAVKYDQYGLYGVTTANSGEAADKAYVPTSIDDIKRDASFGLLWDGFFIKNFYGTHEINISNLDDITLKKNNYSQYNPQLADNPKNLNLYEENNGSYSLTKDTSVQSGKTYYSKTFIDIIKIGKITDSLFGIRFKDNNGNITLETANDGKLWLSGIMNIAVSNDNNYNVKIGKLDNVKEGTSIKEIINATDNFIVYEDGSIIANDGYFKGTIEATGGKIGNLTIEELQQTFTDFSITALNGRQFIITSNGDVQPESLSFKAVSNTLNDNINDTVWLISNNGTSWTEKGTGETYTLSYSDVGNNKIIFVRGKLTVDNETYFQDIDISILSDGQKGDKGDPADGSFLIEFNQNEILKSFSNELSFSPEKLIIKAYDSLTDDIIEQELLEYSIVISNANFSQEIDLLSSYWKKYPTTYTYIEFDNFTTGDNPKQLELYEYIDGEYILTNDTIIDNDKTYYKKQLITESYAELDIKALNELNNILFNNDFSSIYFEVNRFNYIEYNGVRTGNPSSMNLYDYNNEYSLTDDQAFEDNKIYYIKIDIDSTVSNINIRFVTTSDLARFSVTANAITAAIDNSKMSFSKDGLQIFNNGLSILKQSNEYIIFNGNEFDDSVTYYELVNDQYIETTDSSPISGKVYYTYNNILETLLAYDIENKQLLVKGSGEFTGTIYAFNGEIGGFTIGQNQIVSSNGNVILDSSNNGISYFNGEIVARQGRIGGFVIEQNQLYSTEEQPYEIYDGVITNPKEQGLYEYSNGNYILSEDIAPSASKDYYFKTTDSISLVLNGQTGQIKANNIILGYAVLSDRIIVGEDIYLSSQENDYFIKAGNNFYVNQDGSVNMKNAIVSGTIESALIKSGRIETASFVTNKINSMGGGFIFKPTYSVESFSKINDAGTIWEILPEEYELESNNMVIITGISDSGVGTFLGKTILNEELNKIYVQFNETINFQSISSIMIVSNNLNNASIIGINSDDSDNIYGFLRNNSLTITNMDFDNNTNNIALLLGDLESVGINDLTGYGLYCDQVYLNGSLVTKTGNYSAGISTSNNLTFSYEVVTNIDDNANPSENNWYYIDSSGSYIKATETSVVADRQYYQRIYSDPIVFWAGATNIDDKDDAPFKVTQNGNLYAKNGEFSDSLITHSIISASVIKTATLLGWREADDLDGYAPLKIFSTKGINDSNRGIQFLEYTNYIDGEYVGNLIFEIKSDGFYTNNDYFISIDNDNIHFKGIDYLAANTLYSDGFINCSNTLMSFYNDTYSFLINNENKMNITQNQTQINTKETAIFSDLTIGNKMTYTQINGNYALFVTE